MNKGSLLPVASLFLLLSLVTAPPAVSQTIRVASDFQAWADADRNGILSQPEIDEILIAAQNLLAGPHEVRSPLDRMFDVNNDGRLTADEVMRARMEFFKTQVLKLPALNPELAKDIDPNNDGRIEDPEAQLIMEYMLVDRAMQEPHRNANPLDRRVDKNGDGRVDKGELDAFRTRVFRAVVLMPFRQETITGRQQADARVGVPAVAPLDALADVNGDGVVDELEQRNLEAGLKGPHKVATELDRRLDTNGNGRVEETEIRAALNTAQGPQERPPVEAQGAQEQPAVEAQAAQAKTAETTAAAPAAKTAAAAAAAPATPAATAATTTATAAPAAAATSTAGDLELSKISFDEIFPVFHKYYDTNPIGTAMLKNGGSVAVEKIKVQLAVKGYMTEKKLATGPDRLEPGEEKEVKLFALFTEADVLKITEGTKALANISVEYTAGGQSKTKEIVETIRFENRNAMTWDDDTRAAAFVTAKNASVMKFAKTIVGATKGKASTAVDANLLVGIAIHEALAQYGLSYVVDPKSSYETLSKNKTEVDFLQFPQQTLDYKAGDCDDLSILTCALLEAVSVDTAFVTVPGHIFIAFALKMKPDEARKSFLKPDELIFKSEKAWVPVEVTNISKGLLSAWQDGAKEWRESEARQLAGFTPLTDAWKKYEPVTYSIDTITLTLPADAAVTKAYAEEVTKFIKQEIATREIALQADITKDGGKPETVNKLGVLYAKYGLNDQAEKEFDRILKTTEFVPALLNIGNLSFLKGDAKKALEYYERAEKKEPGKATVLLCIARANHELENYGKVKEAYDKLKTADSSLAAQFAYLDLRGTEATRAADVGGVKGTVVWDEK